jgi:hypothetical protein
MSLRIKRALSAIKHGPARQAAIFATPQLRSERYCALAYQSYVAAQLAA